MPRRRDLLRLAAVLTAGGLAGCTGTLPDEPVTEGDDGDATSLQDDEATAVERRSDGVERERPVVDDDAVRALVREQQGLALAFHRELAGDGNLVHSPYSVGVALAMTYAGARGSTREAIGDALRYGVEDLHPSFNALDRRLESRETAASGGDSGNDSDANGSLELTTANALWGQRDYPWSDAYLDLLARHYGAGLRTVDFHTDPDAVRRRINAWVAGQTDDRITDLLPEGIVTRSTRLVLTNAVYFYGDWAAPFDEERTEDRRFTALSGSESEVRTMVRSGRFPYAEREDHRAVDLPYAGGDLSMTLLLPDDGFETFERSLTPGTLRGTVDALSTREGTVRIPRFDFGAKARLKETLSALGMGEAFGGGADFSGMVEGTGSDLVLRDVVHQANVTVDEQGTEASAATGVVVVETSASTREPFEFVADRPFLFLLRDRPTGAILFLGRVVDAAAAQA